MYTLLFLFSIEIVCIDELEKMSKMQQQVILQAVEHQQIGVRQGEEFLFHPAKVSIVATANLPANGYDFSKTIGQNVRVSLDLIYKFDLVFQVIENSKHDAEAYSKELAKFFEANKEDVTFKLDNDLIPLSIVYRYITYCFDHVHPTVSGKVRDMVQGFCTTEVMVGPLSKLRVFETLSRLVEAHAKLFMRQQAIEQDFFDVIDILRSSLTLTKSHTRKFHFIMIR